MSENKIGFIGTGNIAGAIYGGIVSSGYIKPENILVFDKDSDKTFPFVKEGAKIAKDAKELVLDSDFVFLTIKPQIYPAVLEEIRFVSEGSCFIDVAAGITTSYVKEFLGPDAHVIRAMPNTPLMCGMGSTALVKSDPVTVKEFDFVRGCFDSSGITIVVDESMINVITAISGSAPAYVMRFASDIISFGVAAGLNADDCKKLVLQVFSGSAKLASESPQSLDQLIKNVTSPNGTTEAGLKMLTSDGFDKIVDACLSATVRRAEELSK